MSAKSLALWRRLSIERFRPFRSRSALGAACTVLLLAGCATGGTTQPVDAGSSLSVSKTAETPQSPLLPGAFFADGGERFTAWRCTPSQDLVTTTPDEQRLRLWTALGKTELPAAVVGSGERYALGGVSFWRQGKNARVESDNGQLVCSIASERPTTTREEQPQSIFYASGNEPGWRISLDRQTTSLTLVSDYGQAKDTFDYRVASLDNGNEARVVLVSDSGRQPLEMDLRAGACFDDMSGRPWPVKVTLRYGDQTWQGCGQGVEATR
ncbi:COG3650 family protein [Salinicola avicenniae]|uniref:COG3650 family protein n=1 Tax=Salinicola avicenniae TaxID=2916836 RepID=UPI002073E2FF|nr:MULTISPECIES: MliC family protein [unclassified Salinicola]